MKVIIDRFEGDYAVVELPNRNIANMPKCLVPTGAKEGTSLLIIIDEEDEAKRRARIEDKLDKLFKD